MNRIKELRELKGIKQSDFAIQFNVTQATLSNWERDIHQPDKQSIIKMVELFNTTSDYILGISDDPTPPNKKNAPQTPEDVLRQFFEVSGLSKEAQKDLEKQYKMLKMLDDMKKYNEEVSQELKPKLI